MIQFLKIMGYIRVTVALFQRHMKINRFKNNEILIIICLPARSSTQQKKLYGVSSMNYQRRENLDSKVHVC